MGTNRLTKNRSDRGVIINLSLMEIQLIMNLREQPQLTEKLHEVINQQNQSTELTNSRFN